MAFKRLCADNDAPHRVSVTERERETDRQTESFSELLLRRRAFQGQACLLTYSVPSLAKLLLSPSHTHLARTERGVCCWRCDLGVLAIGGRLLHPPPPPLLLLAQQVSMEWPRLVWEDPVAVLSLQGKLQVLAGRVDTEREREGDEC